MKRDEVLCLLTNYLQADKLIESNSRNLAHKLSNPSLSFKDAFKYFEASEDKRINICHKRDILKKFVAQLSPMEKFEISNYIHGLEAKDLADIFNLSERTVFRSLSKIKRKLDRVLKEVEGLKYEN